MPLERWVEIAGDVIEAAGVAVIILGAIAAFLPAVRQRAWNSVYRAYRQALGKAILLGLEFLVAADIVRTVSRVPSLGQVAVLGGIVLIRTFLSFTLEVELEGRWPWQRAREPGAPREGGRTQTSGPPPARTGEAAPREPPRELH